MIKRLMEKNKPKKVLTLEEIEKQVMTTDSVDQLYALEMDLRRFINQRHTDLNRLNAGEVEHFNITESLEVQSGIIKGDLNMADGLLGICHKRQEGVAKENHVFNRKFREAALKRLSAALYGELCNEARG